MGRALAQESVPGPQDVLSLHKSEQMTWQSLNIIIIIYPPESNDFIMSPSAHVLVSVNFMDPQNMLS